MGFKFQTNKIYVGNALNILKKFPDECVQCIITSPPYWGLRNYQTQPVVWKRKDYDLCNTYYLRDPKKFESREHCDFSVYSKDRNSVFCSVCGAWKGELGLEPDFHLYVDHMLAITSELMRVLKSSGSLFLVIGDTYWGGGNAQGHTEETKQFGSTSTLKRGGVTQPVARGEGYQDKSLVGIPWRLAIKMMDDQRWIMRNDIPWDKPNAMPHPVTDRFTVSHEPVFFFTKSQKYYFKQQFEPFNKKEKKRYKREKAKGMTKDIGKKHDYAVGAAHTQKGAYDFYDKKQGKNMRTVWRILLENSPEAHSAQFPTRLVKIPIFATTKKSDIVLDPFLGSGTTALMALRHARQFIGIELNREYAKNTFKRLKPHLSHGKLPI